MYTFGRLIRTGGMLLANLFLAVLGTVVLVSPLERFAALPRISQLILRDETMNSAASFGLGYFAYQKWRPAPAKWVWLAGLCWFGQRAFRIWLEQRTSGSVMYQGHTVYWEMSGSGCGLDALSCRNWALYTIPLLRALFYSAGAFCCSHLRGSLHSIVTFALPLSKRGTEK